MTHACDLLYRHWQEGTVLDTLPPELRPRSRAEAYRIQAAIEAYSEAPLFGWKIAATSKAGQAHIAVDGPMAGRLLAERAVADGGACPLGANRMRVAELEFGFRMGADLLPRAIPFSQEEVLAHVASLHPAIELPDSRYSDFTRVGEAQLIADNACAHRFVFGAATDADWRGIDLAAHKVFGFRNGTPAGEGSGVHVLGDPRIALTWLANELSILGLALRAGQAVITGTCVTPIPIAAGDAIDGDFGSLGRIAVRIA